MKIKNNNSDCHNSKRILIIIISCLCKKNPISYITKKTLRPVNEFLKLISQSLGVF